MKNNQGRLSMANIDLCLLYMHTHTRAHRGKQSKNVVVMLPRGTKTQAPNFAFLSQHVVSNFKVSSSP